MWAYTHAYIHMSIKVHDFKICTRCAPGVKVEVRRDPLNKEIRNEILARVDTKDSGKK